MKMRLSVLSLISASLIPLTANAGKSSADHCSEGPLGDSSQIVLSVSPNWNSSVSRLRVYQKNSKNQWSGQTGPLIKANVGRSGMAWGTGRHVNPAAPEVPNKQEGDGRSPAGVFALTEAFGYDPAEQAKLGGAGQLRYTQVDADSMCIEDSKSSHYNRMVYDIKKVEKDWDSTDKLRREDDLYRFGVVVNHNGISATSGQAGPSARGGSCIFLHVWRAEGKPSAGCTSMSLENTQAVAGMLNPQSKPLLVQLPLNEYLARKAEWCLPELPPDDLAAIATADIDKSLQKVLPAPAQQPPCPPKD